MSPLVFEVFVHREPESPVKRPRRVVKPGELQRIEENKWRLSWGETCEWLFDDRQVLLLIAGGTVRTTTYSRLSITTRPAHGSSLVEYVRALAKIETKAA